MDQVIDIVKRSAFNMLKEEVDEFGQQSNDHQAKIWIVKTGD